MLDQLCIIRDTLASPTQTSLLRTPLCSCRADHQKPTTHDVTPPSLALLHSHAHSPPTSWPSPIDLPSVYPISTYIYPPFTPFLTQSSLRPPHEQQPPPMAEKVKSVAVEETTRIKDLTSDAARSGAWLYPLRVCPAHTPNVPPLTHQSRAFSTSSPTGPSGRR